MSMDVEQRLRVWLASAPQRIARVQVVQISHSAMSKVYTLWDQPGYGEVVIDGDPVETEPCAMAIRPAGSEGHLDQQFQIVIDTTDIADLFRNEMNSIPLDTDEKVVIEYWEFLSDDLEDAQSHYLLQLETVAYKLGTATLSAVAPRLNVTRTGVIYSPRDIPMLRGFL